MSSIKEITNFLKLKVIEQRLADVRLFWVHSPSGSAVGPLKRVRDFYFHADPDYHDVCDGTWIGYVFFSAHPAIYPDINRQG